MTQATSRSFNGRRLRRWYLTLPGGRRVVSWAETKVGARMKCRNARGFDPVAVEPAPPVANMMIRDALQDDVQL